MVPPRQERVHLAQSQSSTCRPSPLCFRNNPWWYGGTMMLTIVILFIAKVTVDQKRDHKSESIPGAVMNNTRTPGKPCDHMSDYISASFSSKR
jgi:hypothetical protein